MIRELVKRNRSYRRFYEKFRVNRKTLEGLVDLARLSPSAANLQPLKYIISCSPQVNSAIFPYLRWAGYLKGWPGPAPGERPSAYIVILGDTAISKSFGCDYGIAAQSMLLGAVAKGLGGCMIGSIDRQGLAGALKIPPRHEILLVLAIGKPKEKVVIETAKNDRDVKYWRDKTERHHVPKRSLGEIILK